MGKYIPRTARPVDAFQWNGRACLGIRRVIEYLNDSHIPFELIGNRDGTVSILVGDVDDDKEQVLVDNNGWLVIENGEYRALQSRAFFDEFQSVPS